ncbi:MAG TPA: hypothetical protein VJU59_50990 [Paraburkholderia sp.]|uniref:hypothetical protein n=1 Tax=Paraburkholderia sp. TaxID=1926495 RepID=UPI002B48335F|nr:hypothetical protein [Paraburkholderia sp.]HKR47909.1 hypothetical protein [Paraburkholderia sp.]
MDEPWMEAVMGSTVVVGTVVLVIATIFMISHYRREHRRKQLLRQVDDYSQRYQRGRGF